MVPFFLRSRNPKPHKTYSEFKSSVHGQDRSQLPDQVSKAINSLAHAVHLLDLHCTPPGALFVKNRILGKDHSQRHVEPRTRSAVHGCASRSIPVSASKLAAIQRRTTEL